MIWTCVTVSVVLAGLVLRFCLKRSYPKAGRVVLALSLIFLTVVMVGAIVLWEAPDRIPEETDYALLLGYGTQDGQPRPELTRRLELALRWMQSTEEIPLVDSDGDVLNSGITEARLMYKWLAEHGADMSRVYLEERAKDTKENVRYARLLIKEMEREYDTVLILTSEYHQTRARFLANRLGQKAGGISCMTPVKEHLIAAVREVYSFSNELLEIILDSVRPALRANG